MNEFRISAPCTRVKEAVTRNGCLGMILQVRDDVQYHVHRPVRVVPTKSSQFRKPFAPANRATHGTLLNHILVYFRGNAVGRVRSPLKRIFASSSDSPPQMSSSVTRDSRPLSAAAASPKNAAQTSHASNFFPSLLIPR